jgi:hypothetical protein
MPKEQFWNLIFFRWQPKLILQQFFDMCKVVEFCSTLFTVILNPALLNKKHMSDGFYLRQKTPVASRFASS